MVDLTPMKNAVANMVANTIYKVTQNQKVKRGSNSGGSVVIGNRVLPWVPAVDMHFSSGDNVWCIISDSGVAVVVGK
jgi:roadblock/LC7 domain-containing protein